MVRVVIVHGIGKQYLGPRVMHGPLAAAVADGVQLATGRALLDASEVGVAFYGDWFRPPGAKGEEYLMPGDITDVYEVDLLMKIWEAAARREPDRVESPGLASSKAPVPVSVQRALDALSHSRHLTGVAEQFLLGTLRQVRRYFREPTLRTGAQARLAGLITPDTQVIVGHSLGSVVAYEALCANPGWPVRCLITLGSPLGIRNLVYDRLIPKPVDGLGVWPEPLISWINVCDQYDVVALVKELAPLFPAYGSGIKDRITHNGWKAHQIERYLTAAETGSAVAEALVGEP
jgi:hypothetical protein